VIGTVFPGSMRTRSPMAKAEPTRPARGELRRRAILQAALRVISERGVDAVSHRTAAEEAGVPLASTTYYFESLDELLEGALRLFVDEEAARLTALAERLEGQELPPLEVARLFRSGLEPDVAQFELYVEAARRPRLREVARRSIEMYSTVAAAALGAAGLDEPAITPRAFVALFDGYGLHRVVGCDDQGLEDALLALWAAATRAIGTRYGEQLT
jgi:TetR/AcrR family transcriptional regulator, regulator of biofilm formation and stress response